MRSRISDLFFKDNLFCVDLPAPTHVENKRHSSDSHEEVDKDDGKHIGQNMAEEPLQEGLEDSFLRIRFLKLLF